MYRTAPDDSNRMQGIPCLTIAARNNSDIRNYLLADTDVDISKIPTFEKGSLREYELWKESVDPHQAFFYFDLLFGELEILGDEAKLPKLEKNGYVFLRNEMGRKWEEYDEHEAREYRYYHRTPEEIEAIDKELRKEVLRIAYSLEELKVVESTGWYGLLSKLIFELKKKTIYKGITD